MKHTLKVFAVERTLMNSALDLQKRTDNGYRRRLFHIAQMKVNQDEIKMDGMEMELTAIACRRMARILKADRRHGKAQMYFDLAQWIMNEKKELQNKHKKEAATSKVTA